MKKLLSSLFVAALVLAACGGSDDDAATVAVDGDAAESSDTESGDTESGDTESGDTESSASSEDDNAGENEAGEGETASEESGGDLSDDEAALVAALTAVDIESGDAPFTDDEIQCVNEELVRSLGLDALNSYGITVDTPDSSLLPNEYEVQRAAFAPLPDCLNVGETFRGLTPDCDIALSDEQFDLALEFDFLSTFPEYDNPAAEEASAALQEALLACDTGS